MRLLFFMIFSPEQACSISSILSKTRKMLVWRELNAFAQAKNSREKVNASTPLNQKRMRARSKAALQKEIVQIPKQQLFPLF
jgi:hypothetical protein